MVQNPYVSGRWLMLLLVFPPQFPKVIALLEIIGLFSGAPLQIVASKDPFGSAIHDKRDTLFSWSWDYFRLRNPQHLPRMDQIWIAQFIAVGIKNLVPIIGIPIKMFGDFG
jgi:hypothetical protein